MAELFCIAIAASNESALGPVLIVLNDKCPKVAKSPKVIQFLKFMCEVLVRHDFMPGTVVFKNITIVDGRQLSNDSSVTDAVFIVNFVFTPENPKENEFYIPEVIHHALSQFTQFQIRIERCHDFKMEVCYYTLSLLLGRVTH